MRFWILLVNVTVVVPLFTFYCFKYSPFQQLSAQKKHKIELVSVKVINAHLFIEQM